MANDMVNRFKLGFGLMRLPRLEDGSIDVPQVSEMVDLFLEAGGTYFDTAFAYPGSEEAIKKALVERYPRDSYTLATKLMCNDEINDEETAKNYEKYDRFHLWDYVKELKEKGLIRHYGFSFHADPELLEELLRKHPDVDFVQLQINYADWENPGVNSKKNLEICKAHGIPVTVMEPVKGGILADPIDSVKAILDAENNGMSYSSWAIRFVCSQEGIFTVLSGMSNVAQMEDNLSYMKDFKPLDEHELEVIKACQAAINADQSIPCTACHYCTAGCPMDIPIPEIFAVENRKKGSPAFRTKREYTIVTQGRGQASDCVHCGQCEGICPQHLPIISLLERCREIESY